MMISVIIVACLIARPTQCEAIPTGQSVGSEAACAMAGQMFAAARLNLDEWMFSGIRCEAGFVDENHG